MGLLVMCLACDSLTARLDGRVVTCEKCNIKYYASAKMLAEQRRPFRRPR